MALFFTLALSAEASAQAELLGGFGGPRGYGGVALDRGDDSPSLHVDLSPAFPEGLHFFGRTFDSTWININGNITFGAPYSTYTPTVFPSSPYPMIAPWWADVDLNGRGAHNVVYYTLDDAGGRLIVTWLEVGYYLAHIDKLNSFQMILTDRRDLMAGDFDVEFRYNRCQWTTGDITGHGGFGGRPAVAGFDAGNRSDYSVIPGSGEHAVLNLCQTSNVGIPGVWRFSIHRGLPNFCGDGALSDDEECDEGPLNSNAPDACRTTCQLPVCGDGIVDTGEECDAGASNSDTRPDGCRSGCAAPVCGDGVVDTGEACDNGAANSDAPGAGCRTDCQIAVRTRLTPDAPVPQIGPIEVPPSDPVAMERLDRIWGQRRRPILLNRRYLKAGRHELGLFGGVVPNHPFLEYYPVGLRYDLFISESLGIELDGAYIGEVFRRSSNLREFLQRHEAGLPVDDVSLWRAHLGVQWSPFYSKIAFLGQKLLHFDMGLYAGLGAVGAGRLDPGGDLVDESVYLEGAVGVTLRVFLGRHAALRIDTRQLLSESTAGGLSHPVEITGGIGFFFP